MILILILRDNVSYYFINMFAYNKKIKHTVDFRVFIILINNCKKSIIFFPVQKFGLNGSQ